MLTRIKIGVLYASIALPAESGFQRLDEAVKSLLENVVPATAPDDASTTNAPTPAKVLWRLQYQQSSPRASTPRRSSEATDKILVLPSMPLDLVFDDAMLDGVKDAWQRVMGEDVSEEEFMVFESREGLGMDMGDEDE